MLVGVLSPSSPASRLIDGGMASLNTEAINGEEDTWAGSGGSRWSPVFSLPWDKVNIILENSSIHGFSLRSAASVSREASLLPR